MESNNIHSNRQGNDISVIKVGGGVVEEPASLSTLLDQFVQVPGPKVLVHGGGRTATGIASQLGIETKMIAGRRVTDSEMLRIVTMTYGGLVNKNIVAQLQARGINALGLTGADLNIICAHRRPVTAEGIDYGFVGDVDEADGEMLARLLHASITPVIAPLTHDGQGHLLNTNADTMAQTVATALSRVAGNSSARVNTAANPASARMDTASVTLTFCFELPGVMRDATDPQSLIQNLDEKDFRTLVRSGVISGGMIPKLENAFTALHAGVSRVIITKADNLNGGTCIQLRKG